mmetsp:Transcript_12601/g.20036  ORF Transcript_12601/g.20036 Transcript_12601/m.20036 type:complete len:259 (+) Transcript_12601:508-1284(+)
MRGGSDAHPATTGAVDQDAAGPIQVYCDLRWGQRAQGVLKANGAADQHGHRLGQGHLGCKDNGCAQLICGEIVDHKPRVTSHDRLCFGLGERVRAASQREPFKKRWEVRGVTHALPSSIRRRARARKDCAWDDSGLDTTIGAPPSAATRMSSASGISAKSGTPSFSASAATPPCPKMCSSWPHLEQIWVLMFSTIPTIGVPSFSNMLMPLRASSSAMSCGVETTKAPVSSAFCARVICTSPVPGGRSTISTSSAPHCT